MHDLVKKLVWGKRANRWEGSRHKWRHLVITERSWCNLKDDIYDNLPRKEAAQALKIMLRYERRMLTAK